MRLEPIAFLAATLLVASGAPAQQSPAPDPVPPGAPAQDAPVPFALPSVALPPELARVLRDYQQAWMLNQPADVAELFTADGMALPDGSPPVRGPAQIAEAYARNAGQPVARRPLAYAVSHEMAYIVGGYSASADTPEIGKFVLVLRRAPDGSWKIAADMDNLNALPSPSQPPEEQPAPAATAPGQ